MLAFSIAELIQNVCLPVDLVSQLVSFVFRELDLCLLMRAHIDSEDAITVWLSTDKVDILE